jgi:hypothetical protein
MADINLMPDDFEPGRRGRVPTANITDLLSMADGNPDRWVSQTMSENHAASALRQLKKYGVQYDVVSNKDGKSRIVFIKRVG